MVSSLDQPEWMSMEISQSGISTRSANAKSRGRTSCNACNGWSV